MRQMKSTMTKTTTECTRLLEDTVNFFTTLYMAFHDDPGQTQAQEGVDTVRASNTLTLLKPASALTLFESATQ
jgi:hypothetical protein